MSESTKRLATYLYVVSLTVLSILACLWWRELSLDDKPGRLWELFAVPLGIADGFVLGFTISILTLKVLSYFCDFDFDMMEGLEFASGAFSFYALIFGVPILISQFGNQKALDILLYSFIFLCNYSNMRKGLVENKFNAG